MNIYTTLLEMSSAKFGLAEHEISLDDDLYERLSLTSLQALELVSLLEQTFQVEIPDYELIDARSLRDIGSLLELRLPVSQGQSS